MAPIATDLSFDGDASTTSRRLRVAIAGFAGLPFAVLDGAQYENLPALLKQERLFGRSLFLDHADRDIEAAGAWLVALDQGPDAAGRVLSLVGDRPAAVFWSCAEGEAALYRHLRTLGMARIPAWAAEGLDAPAAEASAQTALVMFRHYDPRVLGTLMPALDAGQFARLLGPAEEIAFATDLGVRRALRQDETAPPGPLTLRDDQMRLLADNRAAASRRRIAAYLREAAPAETKGLGQPDLLGKVTEAERSGLTLGLASERAQGKWAYLMLAYQRDAGARRDFEAFVSRGQADADRQLDRLFNRLILQAAKREA